MRVAKLTLNEEQLEVLNELMIMTIGELESICKRRQVSEWEIIDQVSEGLYRAQGHYSY